MKYDIDPDNCFSDHIIEKPFLWTMGRAREHYGVKDNSGILYFD